MTFSIRRLSIGLVILASAPWFADSAISKSYSPTVQQSDQGNSSESTSGESTSSTTQEPQTPTSSEIEPSAVRAEELAKQAKTAQDRREFSESEKLWRQLLADHPQWPQRSIAQLNLGICLFEQDKFQTAIDPLKLSLAGLPAPEVPRALLFLGYAQLQYGNQLQIAGRPDEIKQAGIYLTTASATLGKIVASHPEFADRDQAIYFQGQAFFKLGRFEDSIQSLQQVIKLEDSSFHNQAQIDLAIAYQQSGKLEEALVVQADHLAEMIDDPTRPKIEIDGGRLRIAETKMQLAAEESSKGNREPSHQFYLDADNHLKRVAERTDSKLRDQALYYRALCAIGLEQTDQAIQWFKQVAEIKDSDYRDLAIYQAGRHLVQVKRYNEAIDILKPLAVIQNDRPDASPPSAAAETAAAVDRNALSRYGPSAAILLSNAYRKAEKFSDAEKLTDRWIAFAANRRQDFSSEILASLMFEKAESILAIPQRETAARVEFLKIVDEFPNTRQSPEALFKVVSIDWYDLNNGQAPAMADRFLRMYSRHPRIGEVKTILGDAKIAAGDFGAGETVFRELIEQFPESESVHQWTVRVGWSLYLQKKYQKSADWLKLRLDTIPQGDLQSEAYHWIGCSQFELQQYSEAAAAFKQAIESDPLWAKPDQTLLILLRCEIELANLDTAIATIGQLQTNYPNSKLNAEAAVRLGDALAEANRFSQAVAQYRWVTENRDAEISPWRPIALSAMGWTQLKSNRPNDARIHFEKLFQDFAKTSLAQQAVVGWAIAMRKLERSAAAIENLKTMIDELPDGQAKVRSQFELGLAYAQNQKWPEAEALFAALVVNSPPSPTTEKALYEWAWTLKKMNRPREAAARFKELVDQFPNSDRVSEASYQVATGFYDTGDFSRASKYYEIAASDPRGDDKIQEKSAFRLAWCRFRQSQFDQAAVLFQAQTTAFSEGDLLGDGLFMLGESYARQGKHENALQAYLAAKPVFLQSRAEPQVAQALLAAATSANLAGQFQVALENATPLMEALATEGQEQPIAANTEAKTRRRAALEIGIAHQGLGQSKQAIRAWQQSVVGSDIISARSSVFIADALAEQGKLVEAIAQHKSTFSRYGGQDAAAEFRPLQAYAVYQAARLSYTLASQSPAGGQMELIDESIGLFEYLIKTYPNQPLATQARQQLAKLNDLKQNN